MSNFHDGVVQPSVTAVELLRLSSVEQKKLEIRMPNGGYDFSKDEWSEIERYFKKIETVLNDFSRIFGLLIDKYYHDDSAWDFRFIHPLGGEATVTLRYDFGNRQAVISGTWHLDVYEEFTRYIRWGDKKSLGDDADLMRELKEMLRIVLSWQKCEMIPYGGYKRIWGRYSKADFEKMGDHQIGEVMNISELRP